jgi:hypothetical protein
MCVNIIAALDEKIQNILCKWVKVDMFPFTMNKKNNYSRFLWRFQEDR